MSGLTNVCALCLRLRPLRDSHLIPAGILRQLRDDGFKNPNPYIMSPDYIGQSSAQAKQYLLCHDCEHRFNLNGEKWVAANCYCPQKNTFRLREKLECAQPILSGPQGGAYNASTIPEIDIEKLVYFGTSVIWRASLRSWQLQKQVYQPIEVCPAYKEELRLYLLGDPFPQNAVANVCVSTLDVPSPLAVFPDSLAEGSIRVHRFYIPGIWFLLLLGEKIPEHSRQMCILRSPSHPICRYVGADALFHEISYELYTNKKRS
jgi:hypothetical protein